MSRSNLELYYRNTFNLAHLRKFASITELENMYPYERDIYVTMIRDQDAIEEEQRRQQAAAQAALANRRY